MNLLRRTLLGASIAAMVMAACQGGQRGGDSKGSPSGSDGPGPDRTAALSTTERLDRKEGQAIYSRWCVPCHGIEGRGDGISASRLSPQPKDLTSPASCGLSREEVANVISGGALRLGRPGVMPMFGSSLKRHEIVSLATHVKWFCTSPEENAGPTTAPADTRPDAR